jgi:hypothetical protein
VTLLRRDRDVEVFFDFTHGRRVDGSPPELVAPAGWDVVPPPWGIRESLLLDASDRLAMLDVWDRVTAAFDEFREVAWV